MEGETGMEPHAKEDAACSICHLYLHLSAVECDCCPGGNLHSEILPPSNILHRAIPHITRIVHEADRAQFSRLACDS